MPEQNPTRASPSLSLAQSRRPLTPLVRNGSNTSIIRYTEPQLMERANSKSYQNMPAPWQPTSPSSFMIFSDEEMTSPEDATVFSPPAQGMVETPSTEISNANVEAPYPKQMQANLATEFNNDMTKLFTKMLQAHHQIEVKGTYVSSFGEFLDLLSKSVDKYGLEAPLCPISEGQGNPVHYDHFWIIPFLEPFLELPKPATLAHQNVYTQINVFLQTLLESNGSTEFFQSCMESLWYKVTETLAHQDPKMAHVAFRTAYRMLSRTNLNYEVTCSMLLSRWTVPNYSHSSMALFRKLCFQLLGLTMERMMANPSIYKVNKHSIDACLRSLTTAKVAETDIVVRWAIDAEITKYHESLAELGTGNEDWTFAERSILFNPPLPTRSDPDGYEPILQLGQLMAPIQPLTPTWNERRRGSELLRSKDATIPPSRQGVPEQMSGLNKRKRRRDKWMSPLFRLFGTPRS